MVENIAPNEVCPACNGDRSTRHLGKCPVCDDKGHVPPGTARMLQLGPNGWVLCPVCNGTGGTYQWLLSSRQGPQPAGFRGGYLLQCGTCMGRGGWTTEEHARRKRDAKVAGCRDTIHTIFSIVIFFFVLLGVPALYEIRWKRTENPHSVVASRSGSEQSPTAQPPNKALEAAETPVMAREPEIEDASSGKPVPAEQRLDMVTVETVISGNSFWTDKGKKVRLVGVDAPFWSPSKSVTSEPGGVEAYKFTKDRVEGFTVNLKYDRQLSGRNSYSYAYVFLDDGEMLNTRILENGLARVDARASFLYLSEFMMIEEKARLAKKGIWGSQ